MTMSNNLRKSVASKLALWEIEKKLSRMTIFRNQGGCVPGIIKKCVIRVQKMLCVNLMVYFCSSLQCSGIHLRLQHSESSVVHLGCVSGKELRKATREQTLKIPCKFSLHNFDAGHYPCCSKSRGHLWCLYRYWCHLCPWENQYVCTCWFLHDLENKKMLPMN